MKLYELSEDYRKLLTELDNEESQQDNIAAILSEVKAQFNDKVENIGKMVLSLKADAETLKLEEQRLSKRRHTIEAKSEWLETYLKNELTNTGVDNVKGTLVTVSLKKNPASVNVIDEKAIPKEYMVNIPESWQPDKKKILSLLSNENYKLVAETKQIINKETGEIIDGFTIINDKKHLEIK
jgi:hypothetical protein